jgi:CRP/FNR family transcriptional regulator, cyclic AMP receptor protein
VTLQATLEDLDEKQLASIVEYLREISGDASLTLQKIEEGSVKLILEGSEDGFNRIEALFRSGQLTELIHLRIQNVSQENVRILNQQSRSLTSKPQSQNSPLSSLDTFGRLASEGMLALARGDLDLAADIRSSPFFAGLPKSVVDRATSHVVLRNHPANQVILLENDWGSSVYFILSGWVKIRTYNLDGKEVTLNILGRGELFGEMAPLDEVPRSTDVITLTPTVIGNMPANDFVQLLNTEPQSGIRLAQLMARRLRQVNRRLRLRESDSVSRLADILLFLADGQGQRGFNGTEIPNLPHRELSSLSGLARETVTRVLSKLERKGLIVRDRDILCIPDLHALERLMM